MAKQLSEFTAGDWDLIAQAMTHYVNSMQYGKPADRVPYDEFVAKVRAYAKSTKEIVKSVSHDDIESAMKRAWREVMRERTSLVRFLTEDERDALRQHVTCALSRELIG